jgi:hypothetical protein
MTAAAVAVVAAGLLEAVAAGGSSVEKTFRVIVALSQSIVVASTMAQLIVIPGMFKARVGFREIIFGGWW